MLLGIEKNINTSRVQGLTVGKLLDHRVSSYVYKMDVIMQF